MKKQGSTKLPGTDELFAMAFDRLHECKATNDALMFLLLALLEQIPHDKGRLLEAMTRYYDSLNTVMERDDVPNEQIREVVRQKLDLITAMFCGDGKGNFGRSS